MNNASLVRTLRAIERRVVQGDCDQLAGMSAKSHRELHKGHVQLLRLVARLKDEKQEPQLPFNGSHAPDCPYRHHGECSCWQRPQAKPGIGNVVSSGIRKDRSDGTDNS